MKTRTISWCALLVVLLVSCGRVGAEVGEPSDPASVFGASRLTGQRDGAGIELLSIAERWVEVIEAPKEFTDDALIDAYRFVVVDMEVAPASSLSSIGQPRIEPIDIHTSFFPGLDWALKNEGRAFLALAQEGLDAELVAYALVRAKDGTHFFPGGGAYESLTLPARSLLSDRIDAVLDKLVGMTDGDQIRELLFGPPSPTPSPPVILNPEDVPLELLESLDAVSLVMDRPEDWVGPFTVCTKIAEGWNECADMATDAPFFDIIAYVGPSRTLEFWLLDQAASVIEPVQLLGSIDLKQADKLITAGNVVVRVTLGGIYVGQEDPEQPIKDPSVTLTDVVPWSTVFAHPDRYADLLD